LKLKGSRYVFNLPGIDTDGMLEEKIKNMRQAELGFTKEVAC